MQNAAEPRCLIPTSEIMRRAGIRSANTLKAWIATGKLPPLITIGAGRGARHFGVEGEVDAAIARLIDRGKQADTSADPATVTAQSERMRRIRRRGGAAA